MNNGLMWVWIGTIMGGVLGVSCIGTYSRIKNTNGPRERSFMVKAVVVLWIAVLVFLALFFVLPNPYRWNIWIPYGILLPVGIIFINRKQQTIRQEESQQHQADNML